MVFFLILVFIVATVIAVKVLKGNEEHRQAEENQRRWEEEQEQERQRKLEEEAEKERREQEMCESLNEACKEEYEAWKARFCTEDNPGYKIAGINLQKLTERHVGAFKGTLKAEDWNAFDPKAVAIYKGQKKVGYIPKEYSATVFDSLKDGKGVCYGCIYRWYKWEKYLGRVQNYAGKIIIGPLQESEGQ